MQISEISNHSKILLKDSVEQREINVEQHIYNVLEAVLNVKRSCFEC